MIVRRQLSPVGLTRVEDAGSRSTADPARLVA